MQGDTPGLPSVPACTRPTIPQLMAQPAIALSQGYARLCEGLPALAQIRPGDSARCFTAVQNIWAGDQYEMVTEHDVVECNGDCYFLSIQSVLSRIFGATFSYGTLYKV